MLKSIPVDVKRDKSKGSVDKNGSGNRALNALINMGEKQVQAIYDEIVGRVYLRPISHATRSTASSRGSAQYNHQPASESELDLATVDCICCYGGTLELRLLELS